MAYLATSAAPGMAGFGAGRPKPQPLIRVHSFLINKNKVSVSIQKNDVIVAHATYQTDAAPIQSQKHVVLNRLKKHSLIMNTQSLFHWLSWFVPEAATKVTT